MDALLLSNPFAKQLTVSMMERASLSGAVSHALMLNHRAHGNLERVASELFYDGKMRSGIPTDKRSPPTQAHVHEYMNRVVGKECAEPRALVHLAYAQEAMEGRSFYNAKHQAWILARVIELLGDDKFRRVDEPCKPGSIMIIAPYQAAISQYRSLVSSRLSQSVQERVDIRTVDTAQGHQVSKPLSPIPGTSSQADMHEADVVFLDMVRTSAPGFMDDAHRLCVAITRARQAEFIVMNPRMLRRSNAEGMLWDTDYLMPMWRQVFDKGQYVKIEKEEASVW